MNAKVLVLLSGALTACGLSSARAADQTVLPDRCAVVIEPGASATTRFAADELAAFLTRRFSGHAVPVKTAVSDGEFAFVVGDTAWGRAAGVDPTKLPRDGFQVKSAPGRVYLAGVDSKRDDLLRRLRQGTEPKDACASVFAVYDFLEKVAGCRFFFPGELGEIVPKGESLVVGDLDYTSAPDFSERRIYDGRHCTYFDGDGKYEKALNQVRTRMQTRIIPCCHGLRSHDYIRRFGKTHPEYFALQQGRRNTNPNYAYPHQFCFSNADFREEVYKDIVKAFKAGEKYFDCMPQDSMVPCECEKCRAAYAAHPGPNPATDLVWGMVGEWGRRLIKDGIPGELTLLAYSPYKDVPNVDLPTNIQVMVAVGGPFSIPDKKALAKEDALIRAWVEKVGHRVWLWTYPDKYGQRDIKGPPSLAMHEWGEYYPSRKDLIFGSFAESETERWFFHHLNYYIYGKQSWDNSLRTDDLIADYLEKMFGCGELAKSMGGFLTSLEEKWTKEVVCKMVDTPLGPESVVPSADELWNKVYSKDLLSGYDALLTRARELAAKEADPLVAKRVDLYRRELYDPLKEMSDAYFAHLAALAALPTQKAGEEIPLIPYIVDPNKIFGQRLTDNLPERDIPATAKVWKDDKFLHVFFDLTEPRMKDRIFAERKRDDMMIWQDDSVEFHFCPTGDRKVRYQMIVNALGCHMELRRPEKDKDAGHGWDPDVNVEIGTTEKGWTCHVSVPLDSFEPLAKRVPMEFCRSRKLNRDDKYTQLFHTSPLVRLFGNAADFSLVEFK